MTPTANRRFSVFRRGGQSVFYTIVENIAFYPSQTEGKGLSSAFCESSLCPLSRSIHLSSEIWRTEPSNKRPCQVQRGQPRCLKSNWPYMSNVKRVQHHKEVTHQPTPGSLHKWLSQNIEHHNLSEDTEPRETQEKHIEKEEQEHRKKSYKLLGQKKHANASKCCPWQDAMRTSNSEERIG